MKRKTQPKLEQVPEAIAPEILNALPLAVAPPVNMVPCIVCGSESRSDLSEHLCWVCRRLKISAWRDSEPMPAQE